MGRAPRSGQRHARARRTRARCGRGRCSSSSAQDVRYALAHDAQEPGVHGAGGAVAGAGHRRQHGDLQLHGCDSAALAAGHGPRVARGRELAEQAVAAGEGGRWSRPAVRDALRKRTYLRRSRGNHGGDFSVSGLRAPPAIRRSPSSPASSPTTRSGRVNLMIKGEAEVVERRIRVGRLLSRPRRAGRRPAGCSTTRGRSRGRSAGRCRQHGSTAERRFGDAANALGQAMLINNHAVHRRRRDAGRVLRRRSVSRARHLSPDARQPGARIRCAHHDARGRTSIGITTGSK